MNNKSKMSTESIVSFIVALAISLGIGIPLELPTILIMLILFGIFGTLYFIMYKIKSSIHERAGIDLVSADEREKVLSIEQNGYSLATKLRAESQKERYSIDFNLINSCMDMTEGIIQESIVRGEQMQREEAPQKDWALAGGFAAGAVGGLAGAAVALNAMQENANATKRMHQRGRDMVERGTKDLERVRENRKQLVAGNYDGFTYSEIDDSLLDNIVFDFSEIKYYGTEYVEIIGRFYSGEPLTFPNTKKRAHIDGSVLVSLYDREGNNLIAKGYYCAPGRYGNDRSKTGFGARDREETVYLKICPGKTFNKNDGFSIRLEEPKLWLLKL